MKRLFLNFSTTAFVLLMTMGALDMLDKQNYIIAGVFLFLAFCFPARDELGAIFKRRFGVGTDAEADSNIGHEGGSQEKVR
jgi:hypothetical protein